jgi:hypothetical protein
MKPVYQRVIASSIAVLSACQMTSAQTATPAVLVNPGAQTLYEISQAVVALSGFANVTLSDSDLTQSSELVVERKHQRDGKGELLQGRDLEMPQRFQLLLQDRQCWLQQVGSSKRQLLTVARCKQALP